MDQPNVRTTRGLSFWLVFSALCVTTLLSALDLTSISTVLPTLSHDLSLGPTYGWVGSAYNLASTALFPFAGALAQVLGRKAVIMGAIVFFAIGSAVSGAAQNAAMMLLGRTFQGIGTSGILCLGHIILADIVPLKERGLFIGLNMLVFVVAAAVGPLIGGALASSSAGWRWLFYINLPLCAIALAQCLFFLHLRNRTLSWRQKLSEMDLLGNTLIITGTTGCIIAITWAGGTYSWGSSPVLVPLILGFALLFFALWYEFKYAKEPTIPFAILNHRSSASGFLCNALYGLVSMAVIFFIPIYFQACKLSSPLKSSVDTLGLALTIGPASAISGISGKIFGRYRPQIMLGWVLSIIAMALLSLLKADSAKPLWVVGLILAGIGQGTIVGCTQLSVLAPLPVAQTAYALGFFNFARAFAQTWGISIGTSILQNGLGSRLPVDFISQVQNLTSTSGATSGADLSYATIIILPSLPEPLQTTVRNAFAESLSIVWKVMAGFSGAGLLITIFLMKDIPMTTETDETWGMEENQGKNRPTTGDSKETSIASPASGYTMTEIERTETP